jgi:23S rRNA (adenine2503-C2)-methyltransferase
MLLKPASLTELDCNQYEDFIALAGEPAYRAGQLRKWVYQRFAASFEEMSDLPLAFREKLKKEIKLHSLETIRQTSGKDGTVKTLFKLTDDKTIEAALMLYGEEGRGERRTVCVSTQAGCSIGCPFCATGQQGYERNLTPGEIVDQVLYFAGYLKHQPKESENTGGKAEGRISNIVFMGMGEPLANYDNLWQAIETLNAPGCFGLGARNMVISTAGLVPQIKRLSKEKLQVGLAVSLHASDNQVRNKLVPINRKYPLEELIQACRDYTRLTGRRLSFEYILFKGINDSTAQARALAALIKGIKCHVNLIPANLTAETAFQSPPYNRVLAFQNELKRNHINVTLREKRGHDIDAGCGQLRGRFLQESDREKEKIQRRVKAKNV